MSKARTSLLYGSGADINLREEFSQTIRGNGTEAARGIPGIYRRMRRDSNNNLIPCYQCRKVGVQGSSKAHVCDACLGAGFLWDETWIQYYSAPGYSAGRSKSNLKQGIEIGPLETNLEVIYLEAGVIPDVYDQIISVVLDAEGGILQPYQRRNAYDIRAIDEYRLDNGRLEYWRLACFKMTLGYWGQPIAELEPGQRRMP